MVIWFAADIAEDDAGGIARVMHAFSSRLENRGHRVHIICRPRTRQAHWIAFALRLLTRLCKSLMHPPDWIIARSTDGLACALAAKTLRLPVKIALHNHGWEEQAFALEQRLPAALVHAPTTWKGVLLRFGALKLMLRLSDCCISGSIDQTRYLAYRYPRMRRKFVYVPNGVEPPPKPAWGRCGEWPPHFLCIGGPTWKKNLAHTIAIAQKLHGEDPRVRLRIVGVGDGARMPDMRGLASWITLERRTPLDAMPRWYAAYPYLISSSRYEGGHSLAILEAMAHQMLVFASSIPSSKEIIRHGLNGMLLTGVDSDTDAACIQAIMRDAHRQRGMRHAAAASAYRNRWARQTERLERAL